MRRRAFSPNDAEALKVILRGGGPGSFSFENETYDEGDDDDEESAWVENQQKGQADQEIEQEEAADYIDIELPQVPDEERMWSKRSPLLDVPLAKGEGITSPTASPRVSPTFKPKAAPDILGSFTMI